MVKWQRFDNSMVLLFNGKTFNIHKDDFRYPDIVNCIRKGQLNKIPKIVDMETAFSYKGLKLVDGQLEIQGEKLPTDLNDMILAYRKDGIPFDSIIKFWSKLRENPSYDTRNRLFKFITSNKLLLTDDGCFVGYRGVTEDFKDPHTRKFNNKPGKICKMPRNAVDDNPNNACSNGLHIGSYGHANGFGRRMIAVKVNPLDVVVVPDHCSTQKMRVCKFKVLEEVFDEKMGHVHSEYACEACGKPMSAKLYAKRAGVCSCTRKLKKRGKK